MKSCHNKALNYLWLTVKKKKKEKRINFSDVKLSMRS